MICAPLVLLFQLDPSCWQVCLATFVLAVVSLLWSGWNLSRNRRRRNALAALSMQMQLPFLDTAPAIRPEQPVFRQGVRQFTLNTIAGPWHGRHVQMGDYQYQTEREDRNGHCQVIDYYFSYCFVPTPEALFVDLVIRPEGVVDRIKAVAGFEDINFESHAFSKKYYVQSLDRKFAYDVISPAMMEYLLERPGYTLHLNYSGLTVTRGGEERWEADEFLPCANFAVNVIARIPPFVWDAYKAARGGKP